MTDCGGMGLVGVVAMVGSAFRAESAGALSGLADDACDGAEIRLLLCSNT
jgi:hypothetical protein